jgi:hypothetical protein
MQGRIEGAFFDAEEIVRGFLNVESDAEAVVGTAGEGLENEEVEGTLERS